MTRRSELVNCLAHHVADSGRPDWKLAACELMDANAVLGFIGRWYAENVEDRSPVVASRWWNDVERKIGSIVASRDRG